MTKKFQLLIATKNSGKVKEISLALHGLPLRLRQLAEFPDVQSVDESGETYEQNAALKALNYSSLTGLCALADDSGLEVKVLGGLPGVHSARYGGVGLSDSERVDKLLALLAGVEATKRLARFISVMALAGPQEPSEDKQRVLHCTLGVCEGRIAHAARGSHGFGYDPVFVPDGYDLTFGQLSDAMKNRISHRAKALNQMRTFIEGFIGA
jgi:XTP/dITP diphosphohydrolase